MSAALSLVHSAPAKSAAPVAEMLSNLRPYTVSIRFGARSEEMNVLAFTTCDAVCRAIEFYFDGEEAMPTEGLEVKAAPAKLFPRAA